jgi:hypothetical protein
MFFFDVTLKVINRGVAEKVVVYKGARGFRELDARRVILNQLLAEGFQVVRIDRVPERCVEADAEGQFGRPGEEN